MMTSKFLKILSPAKINLCLDILRRDKSGYHEIQTVYQELPFLCDDIEVEKTDPPEILVSCDHPDVPRDKTNTALKAALLLQSQYKVKFGAKIKIRKKIPVFSGLGGGSSNAAAVLKALNQLWALNLDTAALVKIANQIGMDCAFFFLGGTVFGTHFGEQIAPLPALSPQLKIEIIDTGVKISSREAYEWVDTAKCGRNVKKTQKLIEGLHEKNPQKILENIHNDFEQFVFEKHPELLQTVRRYQNTPSYKIFLTGCGGALCKISFWGT